MRKRLADLRAAIKEAPPPELCKDASGNKRYEIRQVAIYQDYYSKVQVIEQKKSERNYRDHYEDLLAVQGFMSVVCSTLTDGIQKTYRSMFNAALERSIKPLTPEGQHPREGDSTKFIGRPPNVSILITPGLLVAVVRPFCV